MARISRYRLAAALLLTPQLPLQAQEKPPLVLTPATPWNVHYGDDKCSLSRQFGEGDQATIAAFDRYQPGDSFYLVLSGASIAGFSAASTQLRFLPGVAVSKTSLMGASLANKPALISSAMTLVALGEPVVTTANKTGTQHIRRTDDEEGDPAVLGQKLTPAQEAGITSLVIEERRKRQVRLQLGSMGPPMAALRTCVEELLSHWGIDVPSHRTLTRAVVPIGNPGNWIGPSDYPSKLIRSGSQGIVHFRLMIGADGRPTQCNVQASTRPEGFDQAVCAAMMRKARFTPALDREGKPIASFWGSNVRFVMP